MVLMSEYGIVSFMLSEVEKSEAFAIVKILEIDKDMTKKSLKATAVRNYTKSCPNQKTLVSLLLKFS